MKEMKLNKQDVMDHILHMVSLLLVSVTMLAGLVLASGVPVVHADSTLVSTAKVTVSQSCSMTGTTDTPHTANLHNGIYSGTDYANGIGQTTLRAFCNDGLGFSIYAIGYTGDEYGNNKLHSAELGDVYDIDTGIYTAGTTVNSTWSVKLSSVTGNFAPNVTDGTDDTEDFTNWHEVPSEYTKVAYRTTGTDISEGGSGTGSSLTVTYDAYVSAVQPAGTYVGQVKYTLVHPNTAAAPVTPIPPSATCKTKVPGVTYMQDINSNNRTTILGNMTEGNRYYLRDFRDGKPYCVGKLADGNLWMLDNLALDITALTQAELYGTGSDAGKMTNASNETLGYLKGASSRDATNEPNGNYPTAGVSKAWTSTAQNYYSVPMIAVDSTTSGGCNYAHCVDDPTSGQWSYNSETSGVTSIVQGKIGIYYNYCAASAGSYCYGNGTSNTGSPSSDPNTSTLLDVTEDICPAGWRLPTSNSGGEFQTLYTAYSSNVNNFQTALSTPLSGLFYNGKAYLQGSYCYFWSSTWYDTNNMRSLDVYSSDVIPSDYNFRYFGFSVRCILSS